LAVTQVSKDGDGSGAGNWTNGISFSFLRPPRLPQVTVQAAG